MARLNNVRPLRGPDLNSLVCLENVRAGMELSSSPGPQLSTHKNRTQKKMEPGILLDLALTCVLRL
jgi:hypothetical protein